MIRMVMRDGELRPLTPEDIEEGVDHLIVVLSHFMHVSPKELREEPMDQLHRWQEIVIDLVRAEKGVPKDG